MVCTNVYGYDHRYRRIRKIVRRYDDSGWQPHETHTFVWDDMNIVLERITFADGATRTCEYFWGSDLSGTEQGAGGVGGLLAVSIDGAFFIPCYDHNGNIVCYVSETGAIAGQYVYDPYGNVIEQYGTMPNQFNFGFSTKYFDRETGMLYYQRRFYCPDHGRWLNRDPIEERGGENLYAFCRNTPVLLVDVLGCSFWDDFIDAAKVAVGLCTAVSGALAGSATSWTGAGAVAGGALFILGVDQMFEGINSIASRARGGPSSDNSPIKQIISGTSYLITGTEGSQIESCLQTTYSAIQLTSSCYSGIVTAKSIVRAVNVTYVPPHTELVPVLQRSTVHWQLELKASYWKINGVEDAASGTFSLLFQGISIIKHEPEVEGSDE